MSGTSVLGSGWYCLLLGLVGGCEVYSFKFKFDCLNVNLTIQIEKLVGFYR
jgi:hypothetical protein